ncbi:MAG: hypothetical protein JO236_19495 [Mycobacterium sp.]|uniref:hypothetical protein n=1 Tax=Mycobacterium sp. TaxID=1785 RepID=UPI001EC66094|nr:hypothetical protein [Mycobacterium sp.]MBV9354652.1 hypothetical protein [Chloroflexota bacterium]MBW0019715.1 hypothetical protein [Mycobacterium sp.]
MIETTTMQSAQRDEDRERIAAAIRQLGIRSGGTLAAGSAIRSGSDVTLDAE